MEPQLNPGEYLSKDAISKISLAVKGRKKDVDLDKQAYLLTDGTLIIIEKQPPNSAISTDEGCVNNYKGIKITNKCKASVSYDLNGESKTVLFKVDSFSDLENKWKRFKEAKGISSDRICNLEDISFTDDQDRHIVKLEDAVNTLLNLLMGTNIELGPDDISDMRLVNRYHLINIILINISKNLIQLGISDKIHLPYIVKNDCGDIVELHEYADENAFRRR